MLLSPISALERITDSRQTHVRRRAESESAMNGRLWDNSRHQRSRSRARNGPLGYSSCRVRSVSGRLHGKADERSQQRLRVRCQIRIAAKMLEHEIHESFYPCGQMLAARVVNEDARGLRYVFRQNWP